MRCLQYVARDNITSPNDGDDDKRRNNQLFSRNGCIANQAAMTAKCNNTIINIQNVATVEREVISRHDIDHDATSLREIK